MAITAISKISYAHNGLGGLRSSIMYASKGKPHFSHGELKSRCFIIRGVNCSDNPLVAYREMSYILTHAGNFNRSSISCVRDIESFSKGLNWRNEHDRMKGYKIDEAFVKRHFKGCSVLICGQCDNRSGLVHFHNIICPRAISSGKSITNRCGFRSVAHDMDKTLLNFGCSPLNHGKLCHARINRNKGVNYYTKKGNSFVNYLEKRINKALSQSLNSDEFARNLSKFGISVERFKMRKVNGNRIPKVYLKPTSSGFKELKSGRFLRFRKHFSYSFDFHGKKIMIREKKLGSNYFKGNLLKFFKNNRIKKFNLVFSSKARINSLRFKANNINNKIHKNYVKPIIFGLNNYNRKAKKRQYQQAEIMRKSNRNQQSNQKNIDYQAKMTEIIDEIAYLKIEQEIEKSINNNDGFSFWR